MPSKKTSTKSTASKSAATTAPPAPAQTVTLAAAPVAKKSRAKKVKTLTVAPVPDTPAVIETAAAPAPAVVATETAPIAAKPAQSDSTQAFSDIWESIETQFTSLTTRLNEFKNLYTSINTDLRKLQRDVQRNLKEVARKNRRRRTMPVDPSRPKRSPSGFAKPALISDELCDFLGQPNGTEMARTEVTKHLTAYIKSKNLQENANKRRINPDAKLSKLLNVGPNDEVTYFNLQKYMKVHFPKTVANMAAAAAAAAAATASS